MHRQATAVALAIGVQVGAWCAPWLHAHVDEHENANHHQGRVVHAHLPGHSPLSEHRSHASGDLIPPEIGLDDERSILLQVFVAVEQHSTPRAAVATAVFDLVTPPERHASVQVPAVGGHDPPSTGSQASRAPPASTLS